MPGINPTGTNTAANIKAMAITGAEISFMASTVASRGERCFSSMICWTASTTIMASSTTMPIASTKPNIVSVLMEKPSNEKNAKVPMTETGIARIGINVDLQFCKKKNTTSVTNPNAISKVFTTSSIETFTTETDSKGTT